jgi:hypothetical protein
LIFNEIFVLKRHDENGEILARRRSPTIPANNGIDSSTEISFAASSSILHQQKFRSNTQMTDRSSTSYRHHRHHHHQPKLVRAQSRTHSSSSDERVQAAIISQISSNDTSDDEDPNSILSYQCRLRRKYVKTRQASPQPPPPPPPLSRQQSFREQPLPPTSPTLRYASNGVLLRSKHHQQQQHPNNVIQTSSKDMGKKLKRFTLDTVDSRWHHQYQLVPNNQQIPESNIYRSSMAIVPSLNAHVYGIQVNNYNVHHLSSFKQAQQKDESSHELQQRPKVNI